MRIYLLLLLLLALTNTVFSQTDSLFLNVVQESRIANKASDPVFNGPMHTGYDPAIKGIPYYSSDDWQKGTLVYQHIPYKDIYLKYDLVAGEVIVRHLNGSTGVALFTPRVGRFSLGDRFFIRLQPDEGSGLAPGIYEELNRGEISLFVKRSKFLVENIVSNALERKFVDNNKFYVLKDGQYYLIKKQKDLLRLLDGRKAEISSRLRSAGIRYKSNRELAISKMVAYYNQLSQ